MKKEDIMELVKKIETHFGTKLIQFSSTSEMRLETKIEKYNVWEIDYVWDIECLFFIWFYWYSIEYFLPATAW